MVSIWAGPHWKTDPGLALFGFGIILLQPGGLAAVMLVEKLLWMSPVTIRQMTWIELVLTVAINAGLWWSIARVWRAIRARPIRPSSVLRVFSFSCHPKGRADLWRGLAVGCFRGVGGLLTSESQKRAAFGIGRRDDTPPLKGCCAVTFG